MLLQLLVVWLGPPLMSSARLSASKCRISVWNPTFLLFVFFIKTEYATNLKFRLQPKSFYRYSREYIVAIHLLYLTEGTETPVNHVITRLLFPYSASPYFNLSSLQKSSTHDKMVPLACIICNKSPAKACGTCKSSAYCSKACQTIDWYVLIWCT